MENILSKEIKYVKGVGPNRAELLNKLGIYTLEDLLKSPEKCKEKYKYNPIELENISDMLINLYEAIDDSNTQERIRILFKICLEIADFINNENLKIVFKVYCQN